MSTKKRKKESVYPVIPLAEYVVREHWDTGYVDTFCSSSDLAKREKARILEKLMLTEKMPLETARKFVSCHMLVRIDL
jgi:hypothetical protein